MQRQQFIKFIFRKYSIQKTGLVTKSQILSLPSTPVASPSYPRGPYTFLNREYFIISYESDYDLVRKAVPQPLRPASNVVLYEWIKMPDSTGFGDYQESGIVIPCIAPNGEHVNFTLQMFLDCEPPIAAGREIWGFPKVSHLQALNCVRNLHILFLEWSVIQFLANLHIVIKKLLLEPWLTSSKRSNVKKRLHR